MIKASEVRDMMPCNQRNRETDLKAMTSWAEKFICAAARDNHWTVELTLQEFLHYDEKNRVYWSSVFSDVMKELENNGFVVQGSYLSTYTRYMNIVSWDF